MIIFKKFVTFCEEPAVRFSPEAVNQTAFKVIGNDLTVTLASEAGQLELNVFEPVIAFSLFHWKKAY